MYPHMQQIYCGIITFENSQQPCILRDSHNSVKVQGSCRHNFPKGTVNLNIKIKLA